MTLSEESVSSFDGNSGSKWWILCTTSSCFLNSSKDRRHSSVQFQGTISRVSIDRGLAIRPKFRMNCW
ncbi:hypothetical protein QTJ16_000884 [Diplocarpon rosae]|uniref:Uncharacterized protein n=1 Tax=Diplocarpon rosae TaxID=946125 RepID=A0AAD9WHW6_9HELO|nr:hypothetical protein QTJ16_000884 [Diplocarpon rosae]